MKILLPTLFMFLCVIVSGQTVLVEDSFENYAPDDRIADVSAVG